jgi:two-component system sensor histidine kinase KdpD
VPIPSRGRLATDAGEVLLAVAVCTLAVAALDPIAATAGLTVLYLLGVMVVAVRRGTGAALATAVLAVLALNFFFIAPIHRLTIRDSGNVVALLVFLVVAVVVARLAADARARAQEAGERAAEAAARREEAELVAAVAALLLGAGGVESRLPELGGRIAGALGVREAHVEVAAAPTSMPGLRAVSLPIDRLRVWLHLPTDAAPGAADLDRVLASLAAVIDVALERDALTAAADAADAARRADVAKTAVLHAISHDLRSPLTAITTAAEAMAGAGLRPEDHADLLGVIRGESDRLAGLVDDLLDLSRIQAHAVNPQLDWCDLRDVAASAAAHVRLTPVALEIPDDLPLVRADDAQMERVLANLLDNAARFSPPGQPVRVTGGVGGGWVTVRVIDAGPGVPLGQRSAVFEPFYRGRGARTSTGGAGLGLAICKGFVEANGGRIRLAPDSATGGTAVSVSLPLVEQPAAHA